MYKSLKLLIITFIALPFAGLGQTNEQTAWLAAFNSLKLSKNWGLHLDVQLRSADELKYAKNLLVRPGITYFINDKQNITAGYALIQTFADPNLTTVKDVTEHRIWQQYILNYKIKSVALTHRFRLEQRFIERQTDEVFAQRLRYFVRGLIPLAKPSGPFTKGLFTGLQNELFLNLQHKEKLNNKVFDQNRAYAFLGYRLKKEIDLELGYLNQYVKGSSTGFTNHVAQIAVYSRF